ncbi:MAG TPA: fructosamine kinase family protein [Propionicimonas sp.]|uniref:fructosamine kinase family protein n=1 Tax=Propionicimonas sp. TaxID=1955623 RepID=UPI002F429313
MPEIFVKTAPSGERLDQEAAGLHWLAEAEQGGGTRIVRVLRLTSSRLELEHIPEVAATRESARRFGASLARTHAAGADWFGCAPSGWPGGDTIGRSRQPFILDAADAPATWGAFYADWRIAVFTRRMRDLGLIDAAEVRSYDRLCDRLRGGDFDAPQPALLGEKVARVHGDLWAGNVLWAGGATGAVLIDPLARGDHAESDLGMLALFGLSHLNEVYSAYDEASSLADGWRDRLSLHALSPLMFHALLFGGGYGAQALAVARSYA